MSENNYCQNPLGTSKKANGLRCNTLLIVKNGKTICPKCDVPYGERNLYEKYLVQLGDPHNFFSNEPMRLNRIDFRLREAIGKTDDIHVSLCSHIAIINRELGEKFCRVCQKDLNVGGVGRYNDYLVIRHPQCHQPICFDCADNRPDEFHKSFKKGLTSYNNQKKTFMKLHKDIMELETLLDKCTK